MEYISTRGYKNHITASSAIVSGIAPDGGLFVPRCIPVLSQNEIIGLYKKNFQDIAFFIIKKFIPDIENEDLKKCISQAYNSKSFDNPLICPLRPLTDSILMLELWHGPTCAFKDIALQLLPRLLTVSAKNLGDESTFVILAATSGDTGKAALEGFKDVPKTKVVVFFPQDGVSDIQKSQMVTQEGNNVHVIGVNGNFDHAQSGVKEIFADKELLNTLAAKNMKLSSANSINWGRLLPQIVYYFSSYMALLKSSHIKFGDKINVCIPTGNFGNIMAGYYAKKMGLPINKLIIATNQNDVLARFVKTGVYDASKDLKTTISPSMDILVSSNLERLLFEASGHDSEKVLELMNSLKQNRSYKVDKEIFSFIREDFYADYATEKSTLKSIKNVFRNYKYVVDPHTAVGLHVYNKYVKKTEDHTLTIIASTASPYKFNRSVINALNKKAQSFENKDEFELLNILSATTKTLVPKPLKHLASKPVLHNTVCEKDEMKKVLEKILE
ncbi:MAG: threonine synthase [Deltaproteobacteria bacterium]